LGISTDRAHTAAGELLAEELKLPVYVGMRNWKPFVADTIATMKSDGVGRAMVICLAPRTRAPAWDFIARR